MLAAGSRSILGYMPRNEEAVSQVFFVETIISVLHYPLLIYSVLNQYPSRPNAAAWVAGEHAHTHTHTHTHTHSKCSKSRNPSITPCLAG